MNRAILPLLMVGLLTVNAGQGLEDAAERERALLERIEKLEARLASLEARIGKGEPDPAAAVLRPARSQEPPPDSGTQLRESPAGKGLDGTTFNFYFDGSYGWNSNRPVGRVNLLRTYDPTSNNFSLNQTGMIVERAARPDLGRRWGYRLDLMYGQATETLQGGAQNEPRPQVYRALFQAYGTYVIPLGKGLTTDFGKWAGTLGYEGNYTKDQINYSRGYFFNFLPYYHMGLRTSYEVNGRLSLGYWLVNGANQTEDFNGLKSQLAQAVLRPAKNLTWTLQYYAGQERRDVVPELNPGLPLIPSQPGLSVTPVGVKEDGRSHVVNTYASWVPNRRLTLAGEFNYVVSRIQHGGTPRRVDGGAAFARWQMTPRTYLGQRYTRLNDRSGLFSGTIQALNEVTSTFGFRPMEGFEARLEFRRDFSDTPFFLTSDPARLSRSQSTFTAGLLWWFGGKEGAW